MRRLIASLLIISASLTYLTSHVQNAASAASYTSTPLILCASGDSSNCIKQIWASFPNGKQVDAMFTGRKAETFCENVSGIKTPCTYLEMRVPGLRNEDGRDLIQVLGWIQPPNSSTTSNLPPGAILFFVSPSGWDNQFRILKTGKCATRATELNCRTSYALETGVKFGVKLITSDFVPAWTTGTLMHSEVSYEVINSRGVFTYLGEPGNSAGIISDPQNNGAPESINDFETNMWTIRTIDLNDPWGNVLRSRNCGALNPTMMTDALWVGLPVFDGNSDAISLSVNNPHFLSTGEPASGRFEGIFSDSFTKCFWHKSASEVSGSIQIEITYPRELPVLASLQTKLISTGLQIVATGYHYSSPTLKLSLASQANSISGLQVAPTPTPSQKFSKITSIVCMKGKMTKVVKAVNPICPKGYSKKN